MSEKEETRLFDQIVKNIREAQVKLMEHKAKLDEDAVISDSTGSPVTISGKDAYIFFLNSYNNQYNSRNEE